MTVNAILTYNPLPHCLDSTHGRFVALMQALEGEASYSRTMICKMQYLLRHGMLTGWTAGQS